MNVVNLPHWYVIHWQSGFMNLSCKPSMRTTFVHLCHGKSSALSFQPFNLLERLLRLFKHRVHFCGFRHSQLLSQVIVVIVIQLLLMIQIIQNYNCVTQYFLHKKDCSGCSYKPKTTKAWGCTTRLSGALCTRELDMMPPFPLAANLSQWPVHFNKRKKPLWPNNYFPIKHH